MCCLAKTIWCVHLKSQLVYDFNIEYLTWVIHVTAGIHKDHIVSYIKRKFTSLMENKCHDGKEFVLYIFLIWSKESSIVVNIPDHFFVFKYTSQWFFIHCRLIKYSWIPFLSTCSYLSLLQDQGINIMLFITLSRGQYGESSCILDYHFTDWLVGWLVVFSVPSTARSFRDCTPIYCPLRRTWSSVFTPFRPGIEPRAVAWQSITLPLRHASSSQLGVDNLSNMLLIVSYFTW